MARIRQFRQVSQKKQYFCSWLAQDLSERLFCYLPDLLLTQSIFLLFYVIMFLSFESSDEEKIIIIIYFLIHKLSFFA